jgi:hypothetical protein
MELHIADEFSEVNLLAARIREECAAIDAEGAAVEMASRAALEHAFVAGEHAIQARAKIGCGFRKWLADHGLKKSAIYNYIRLAEHKATVQSSGHFSIAAALRMLCAKSGNSGKSGKSRKSNVDSPLSKAAWTKASLEERREFLVAVGADALCKALSFTLRAELSRRVAGQRRATSSALDETLSKAIRQALSLQKSAKSKDGPAMGVAAALNAINNKLTSVGMDLNDISVAIDPITTRKAA